MKSIVPESLPLRNLIAQTESLLASHERALLGEYKLCATDLAILERLVKKGAKPVNQIAGKVGLTSGSMTTAAQRLLRQDLITTQRDEKDGRRVWINITKEGKQALKKATAERDKLFAPIFAPLSDRESKVMTALLKKIRKASQTKSQ